MRSRNLDGVTSVRVYEYVYCNPWNQVVEIGWSSCIFEVCVILNSHELITIMGMAMIIFSTETC